MHETKRMASRSETFKMIHEDDEFMSSINVPIKPPPIGLKEAFNHDMEVVWQVFIPQFQVNEKLCYLFLLHFLNYWGSFAINGVATIIFCNPQML